MRDASLRCPPWVHHFLVPTAFLLLCPPAVFVFWHVNVSLGGSFEAFGRLIWENGFFSTLSAIWKPIFFGTPEAWKILSCFAIFQLLLMRLLPGKPVFGPMTPSGNVPTYKANGITSFFLTITAFLVGSYGLHWFSPTVIYDHFGPLLGALNCFSLLFCLFLYFKGIFFPSSSDHGVSGSPLFDYYWGTELYPRIYGWDVKQFTNCRFGMMSWALIILSFAAKQQQLYGLSDSMTISVALQLIYIGKFFFWEAGYLRSLDIMHDRAGFMICWGCLVWLPCIYTSPTLYLVGHPNQLGLPLASLIFLIGASSILVNYLADRQRQTVRAKNGECLVWRKNPSLIEAVYQTEKGEMKQSLLLASGWWGIARHFHYIPELVGAFSWSVPALFDNFLPYFYFCFLFVLLLDRAFRHDKRCLDKYGHYWNQYCEKVPYKIIPFIF